MKDVLCDHIEHLQNVKGQYAVAVKKLDEMHKKVEQLTATKYKLQAEIEELPPEEKAQLGKELSEQLVQ